MSAALMLEPAMYSSALVSPSLSGSSAPSAALFGLRAFASSQLSGAPSPSLSAAFGLVCYVLTSSQSLSVSPSVSTLCAFEP